MKKTLMIALMVLMFLATISAAQACDCACPNYGSKSGYGFHAQWQPGELTFREKNELRWYDYYFLRHAND